MNKTIKTKNNTRKAAAEAAPIKAAHVKAAAPAKGEAVKAKTETANAPKAAQKTADKAKAAQKQQKVASRPSAEPSKPVITQKAVKPQKPVCGPSDDGICIAATDAADEVRPSAVKPCEKKSAKPVNCVALAETWEAFRARHSAECSAVIGEGGDALLPGGIRCPSSRLAEFAALRRRQIREYNERLMADPREAFRYFLRAADWREIDALALMGLYCVPGAVVSVMPKPFRRHWEAVTGEHRREVEAAAKAKAKAEKASAKPVDAAKAATPINAASAKAEKTAEQPKAKHEAVKPSAKANKPETKTVGDVKPKAAKTEAKPTAKAAAKSVAKAKKPNKAK